MRLGIDIDDTISNTIEAFLAYAEKYTTEELGREVEKVDFNCTSHHYVKKMNVWSDEELKDFLSKNHIDILAKTTPKFLASEYISKLATENEIYLITARYDDGTSRMQQITKEWLKKYDIPYNEIVFEAENKAEVVRENKIDIFIDDSFENCQNVSKIGVKTILADAITNRNIDLSNENFERAYTWPDIYQKINKYKQIKK